ncbi:MAG: hypothetical protein J7L15_08425, partial [Clostridiales bacterium]|nr:hypothetical protein [Clostridiales bacterium]
MKWRRNGKIVLLVILIFTLLLLTACSKESDDVNSEVIAENNESVETVSEDPKVEDVVEEPAEEITEEVENKTDELEKPTEVLPIYGRKNTNGNFNNGAIVSYDVNTNTHILSLGDGLYRFDPENNNITQLFAIGNGRAKFINVTPDWTYYINSSNGWIYKIDSENYSNIESIVEKDCYDLRIEQHYFLYGILE